jgi:hypothetical protein
MNGPPATESSVLRVGAFCAYAAGIFTLAATIVYLLLPAEQKVGVGGAELLPSVAAGAGLLKLEFVLLALVGIAGLGLVPALVRLVEEGSPGVVRWAGTIATVGYAVTAVSYLFSLGRLPQVAEGFASGDESTQAALQAVWRSSLDLQGFWQFLAVGALIVVVSGFGLRLSRLPRVLSYLGLALGSMHLLASVGSVIRAPEFLNWIVGLGVIVGPVWYVWIGLVLGRFADSR